MVGTCEGQLRKSELFLAVLCTSWSKTVEKGSTENILNRKFPPTVADADGFNTQYYFCLTCFAVFDNIAKCGGSEFFWVITSHPERKYV